MSTGYATEELATPPVERATGRTDQVIRAELQALQDDHNRLQAAYNDVQERVFREGDYLNYVMIHGTKLGTEANNYVRRLQRGTNGFEALRMLRLPFSGGQMLQNYQLLHDLLQSQVHSAGMK